MGDVQEVHFSTNTGSMTLNGTDGTACSSVCRDFLRKVCHRGARCKFVHPETEDSDDVGSPRHTEPIFCHDFQNSECLRPSCKFLHCTRQEEEAYRATGRLPLHVALPPAMTNSTSSSASSNELPLCKDFLKGDCRRAGRCKFRHVGYVDDEPEPKRRALDDNDLAYRVLQQENAILRRKIEEMKKQVGDLTATNEFLLEQNAALRLSKQAAATTQPLGVIPTAALQPVAPLASTADLTPAPQSVTPIVPVVPVSISSSLPASLSQSLAQTIITMSSPSAPLVSYPVMTQSLRPVIAPRMGH
ncbi:zinc finger CCCH domain-containing protein 10-like [Ornithodoros turicata]|uniref:zinc finger CCCH domain-containing protein 10-like n=1 Tax=Ornithodoros turicata TaxID=34597 RepID=UPI003139A7F2